MRARALFALALVAAALLLAPRAALRAQVDPRGTVRTIPTAHFRVHYRVRYRADSGAAAAALARRAAAIAEYAYEALSSELAPPDGPIDLLLADNVDFSNGFAQVFPTNRIVVYAVPPIGSVELRQHDDWLTLVITHELAHIFHLDRARGLWSIARKLFGRNPVLFPNAYTPSWVKEGLAVYYESKYTGAGRLTAAETQAVPIAAARAHEIPPISRWSLSTSRFPRGTTVYSYGTVMMGAAAAAGGDTSMRRFVDEIAGHVLPFRLNRASQLAFGTAFSTLVEALPMNNTAYWSAVDSSGDARWRVLSHEGFFAESPRWLSADSVIWSASNGREVTGVYLTDVRTPGGAQRVARRNALDVNAPAGGDSVVFAQTDASDPYVVRSDLWRGIGAREVRITRDARLTMPDVRRDGAIVAVQLAAASTQLVRVSARGAVEVLTPARDGESWAEPRWSPDGSRLAAVQLTVSGNQRIVVLDTLGVVQEIVTGDRAILASPSFTPDGGRLVWASNRSGRMQLETAVLGAPGSANAPDTSSWQAERAAVRLASAVTTGVYQPSVSPDGRRVVALLYRVDGYHVAVAALDTTGPMVRHRPDAARLRIVLPAQLAPERSYAPRRQLVPRYWLPVIGQGRSGEATYGLSSSSVDILGRHAWAASAVLNPQQREVDGGAAYRYAGLGIPVVDLSLSQSWDATFLVADSQSNVLGTIARRRRFATVSATFARPRVRRSASATVGAQYELRDFTATADSLLGAPDALLRRGTRYPQLFVNSTLSTVRRGALAIAFEEGFTLSTNTSYRWREDLPSTGSWRGVAIGRGYVPLDLPGFSRHVVAMRAAVGVADSRSATEFSVGGVSGVSAELAPGLVLGDPSRVFPVRGVVAGVQRGIRALGGSAEYRVPLVMLRNAPSPAGLFVDRLSLTMFSDAARAWCPGSLAAQRSSAGVCERPGVRDGWLASAGAELVIDVALQYDQPYRLRVGGAYPYVAPSGIARRGALYVSLGSFF